MSERLSHQNDSILARASSYYEEFPELALLLDCGEYASPVDPRSVGEQSIGRQLAPQDVENIDLVELNRSLTCLLAIDDVLNNRYDLFTAEQTQDKLTLASFKSLVDITRRYLNTTAAKHRLRTHIAINDLGKTKVAMQSAAIIAGKPVTDHDEVLHLILENQPSTVPSFDHLDANQKQTILDSLAANVNIGQILQGESSVGSIKGLQIFKKKPDVYQHALMEILYDIAGARGHESQVGSKTITESTFQNFKSFIEAVENSSDNATPADIYWQYLKNRAERFELDFDTARDITITRLCCMLGLGTPSEASEVANIFEEALGISTKIILEAHLGSLHNKSPLIYYAPKIIKNLKDVLSKKGESDALRAAMVVGCSAFANLLSEYSVIKAKYPEREIEHIMAVQIARLAGTSPEVLVRDRVELVEQGTSVIAEVKPEKEIDLSALEKLEDLSNVPGKNIVLVGMGGGSDAVQAGAIKNLLQESGKNITGIISIRASKDSNDGLERHPINPGKQLANGVYEVTPQTKMSSGRYHEDLVAQDSKTILILHSPQSSLADQIKTAIKSLPKADTIIGVDTGGGVLTTYTPEMAMLPIHAIDQDLQTVNALASLDDSYADNILTCIVGADIYAPSNSNEVLDASEANYYLPSKDEARKIIDYYTTLGLPSEDPRRFARTLNAWLMSLEGARGLIEAPLPPHVLLSVTNPWKPFTYVSDASAAMIFMKIQSHARSIGLIT